MHIQGTGHIPAQVVSAVEVTDKLQHLSFNGNELSVLKQAALESIHILPS